MKKRLIPYSLLVAIVSISGFAASCFDQTTEEHTLKPSQNTGIKVDSTRQNAIRLLASRLWWYHKHDSLAAAKPGSTDGDILSSGGKRFTFKTRRKLRVDLDRVLDSLRRTGPLVMGNSSEETDTMPDTNKKHFVYGTMIRQYKISPDSISRSKKLKNK